MAYGVVVRYTILITHLEKTYTKRSKENKQTKLIRLENSQVYKRGSNDKYFLGIIGNKERDQDFVKMYDIQVEKHPSYFADNIPVHNCHQLGQGGNSPKNVAQNALLKLIEEPPEHMYFILCTTNSEMLTKTIRSRCVNFELKPLTKTQTTKIRIWIEENPEIKGCLMIHDLKTGAYYPVEDSSSFIVTVNANDTLQSRFEIEVLNGIDVMETTNESCFEYDNGKLEAEFLNFTGNWTLTNFHKEVVSAGNDEFVSVKGLAAGLYAINWSATHCGSFSENVIISQPQEIKPKYEISSILKSGDELSPNNITTGATSYNWLIDEVAFSNEAFPTFKLEKEGTYELSLEAVNGDCKNVYKTEFTVGPPDNATALSSENQEVTEFWLAEGVIYWTSHKNASQLKIFSTSGQLVEAMHIENETSKQIISELERGTYILELLDSNEDSIDRIKVIY